MRVPVQIICFSCFLFSVTFVQGQEKKCGHPEETKMVILNLERGEIILTEQQWSILARQVTCQLELTESEAVRTIPEGKTIFKAGETVEITCSGKSQIFYKQETFTCTDNGKWDYKPTCEEIKCQVPHNQHVYLPTYYFSGNLNLNVKRSYNCESGYRKMAVQATCKRDGWTPKPLCAEIMCDPPNIPNAEIVGDGTCQEQELKNVEILFGHPGITSPYKPGHILVFRCTNVNMRFYGQRAIECQPDGRWNYPYPQCGGTVQCSQPTTNLRFVTLSDEKTVFSNFEILTYECNEPYNENSGGVLMCQNGKWNGTFICKSGICPPPPYLQHGDYSIISSTEKKVITEVSYTCQSYYVLDKQQESYKCADGIWEAPPKCLRPCEINDIVEKYNLQLPTEKVYIAHANKYRLNCIAGWNTGSEMRAYVDVSCSNGNLQIDKSCDTQNN
uniref:Putative complement factor h-like 3 n=1 Tax=Ctenopharyngodon idella TaxID=7959 RepID=A0A3T0QHP6_CTEID|nr:putative complement factor h-like 3 [Ctenopharyngodon idella]